MRPGTHFFPLATDIRFNYVDIIKLTLYDYFIDICVSKNKNNTLFI